MLTTNTLSQLERALERGVDFNMACYIIFSDYPTKGFIYRLINHSTNTDYNRVLSGAWKELGIILGVNQD